MAKKTITETIIDAGICALVFSTVSYIARSCQNKNDLRKYSEYFAIPSDVTEEFINEI